MTLPRFFVDIDAVSPGDVVVLEGREYHHIRNVMRAAIGDEVLVVNGKGLVAHGRVEILERHRCDIRILCSEQRPAPQAGLFLGMGLLRPSHLDFAIEKGCEVGVDAFVLFSAEKSERKELSSSVQRRLEAIITAAIKQSGRIFRPKVHMVPSLQEALLLLPTPRLVADLQHEAVSLAKKLESLPKGRSLSLLIGPEGGWSHKERALLADEATPVLLHENTLRAETAAMVAAYTVSQWL